MQIKRIADILRVFSFLLTNWNKEPDEERIYRWTEFFHKLDNKKWKMHTGARARKQKYISIYISLYMKTFLKTGVYIYIYIYKYIINNHRCSGFRSNHWSFIAIYIFFIILEAYRKGWHPTSKHQLWHIVGFHFLIIKQ